MKKINLLLSSFVVLLIVSCGQESSTTSLASSNDTLSSTSDVNSTSSSQSSIENSSSVIAPGTKVTYFTDFSLPSGMSENAYCKYAEEKTGNFNGIELAFTESLIASPTTCRGESYSTLDVNRDSIYSPTNALRMKSSSNGLNGLLVIGNVVSSYVSLSFYSGIFTDATEYLSEYFVGYKNETHDDIAVEATVENLIGADGKSYSHFTYDLLSVPADKVVFIKNISFGRTLLDDLTFVFIS